MASPNSGFTRLDLLGSIIGLAVVAAAAAPLLAHPSSASRRAGCYNNLRQVGIAVQAWSAEHEDRVASSTPVNEGGTRPITGTKPPNAWPEFLVLSNHLSSPRLLVCPEDSATKAADNWSAAAGGFANAAFRANALSYIAAYHAYPTSPASVVTGDRDFRPDGSGVTCGRSAAVNCSFVDGFFSQTSAAAWTNSIHPEAGHLLFFDGSVAYVPSARLAKTLAGPELNEASNFHYAPPR